MNSKKEMVPARKRVSKTPFKSLCEPEWELLCRIRANIKSILNRPLKGCRLSKGEGIVREQLRFMISTMNETFDGWPEDPK